MEVTAVVRINDQTLKISVPETAYNQH